MAVVSVLFQHDTRPSEASAAGTQEHAPGGQRRQASWHWRTGYSSTEYRVLLSVMATNNHDGCNYNYDTVAERDHNLLLFT
jgi:hypothetical protein